MSKIVHLLLFIGFMSFSWSQTYKTVRVGSQDWMEENLVESKFRNGDEIFKSDDNESWMKAGEFAQPVLMSITIVML